MDKVVASDHPDCAGGIVWSPCELRWINARLEQQAERVRELEESVTMTAVRDAIQSQALKENELLAAQNEKLREAAQDYYQYRPTELARKALALPDSMQAERFEESIPPAERLPPPTRLAAR